MKAAWFESFGAAADILHTGEQEKPAPGAGQVLVRLMSSGVNPSDVKKRAGSMPELLDEVGRIRATQLAAGLVAAG